MSIEVQNYLNSNINYKRYVREHSIWYKLLNRDPMMIKELDKRIKDEYELNTTDKIKKTLDTIELFENLLTTLK